MAPKDGLEQPTTGGEPVELDVDTFAEVEEAIDRTPVTVSNSDESEEFVTIRCHLSNYHLLSEENSNFLIHHEL